MTGFGRSAFEVEGVPFEVEIRTVNHRHLDIRVRLPRALSACEADLKARAQTKLQRGKLDATVASAGGAAVPPRLEVDRDAVAQLVEVAGELSQAHGLEPGLRVAEVLAVPGITRMVDREVDPEDLVAELVRAWDEALDAVDAMRRREGESLDREVRARVQTVGQLLDAVELRAEGVVEAVRTKLRKRTEKLEIETGLLDEARLHQEIVIAADRLDITEEIVRMRSHIEQFVETVDAADRDGGVGRRLDFLIQEMGREINTIGSKGNDADIAHLVVDLKTELERIREQVQNVE
jgi:uncharacterized protein (TIGR00255 family)